MLTSMIIKMSQGPAKYILEPLQLTQSLAVCLDCKLFPTEQDQEYHTVNLNKKYAFEFM